MRTALLVLSAAAAVFFAASFALTFLARGYITGLAADFVIDRTRRVTEPAVAAAEAGLRAPMADQLLGAEVTRTVRDEVADYRSDPRDYIARMVAGGCQAGEGPAAEAGPAAPLKDRVTGWKRRVCEHFDHTLGRLLLDLRIFSGSNLAAALLAAWFAFRARPGEGGRLAVVAGLLLASVAYGAYMYVDGFTYFRILFGTYLGWWYPALLGITFLGLFLDHGRRPEPARLDSSVGR
jgi:hypothetical protein